MTMIRAILSLLVSSFSVLPPLAQTKPSSSIYVGSVDIQASLKQIGESSGGDRPVRVVDLGTLGYNLGIGVVYRPKGTPTSAPVEHDSVTEIYHVIKGSGLLVTGGVLTDRKARPADSTSVISVNGPSQTGKSIVGGKSFWISDGDVVIIPAGVPHWFKEIRQPLTYLVVRVDPKRVISLK
jgi:mannose-6-phosphate isomerase-like protein (cupin superfamily)